MIRIDTEEIQEFEIKHAEELRRLAPECMVLLKSDGSFPVDSAGELALFGSGARRTIKGGTGSGDVNVRKFTNVEEGLEKAGFSITTKNWLDSYDKLITEAYKEYMEGLRARAREKGVPLFILGMGASMAEPDYEFPLGGGGDICLYVLARNSGEGNDRKPVAGDIDLTETEIRDINYLNSKYSRFMLVLNVGGMVDISPVSGVENVLVMSQLGTAGGDALADVILGKSYPSGRLTTTWAPINDYSSTEGFGHPDDTPYNEGIYVGYRYFDTAGRRVNFPFGFGLGYTDFKIEADDFSVDGTGVSVSFKVSNTGKLPGKEVVQLYYSAPQVRLDKPYQELAAYAKTGEIAPGCSEALTVSFDAADMASYDTQSASYILEKGRYYIRAGNSSRSTHICGAVELSGDAVIQKLRNVGGDPGFKDLVIKEDSFSYDGEEAEMSSAPVINLDPAAFRAEAVAYSPEPVELTGRDCSFEDVVSGKASLEEFTGCLSEDELIYLCIGTFRESEGLGAVIGNASSTVAGAAGETTHKLKNRGVPAVVMADGPAGLRLSTAYSVTAEGVKSATPPLPADMIAMMDDASKEMLGIPLDPSEAEAEQEPSMKYYQYCSAIPIGTALAQSWNDGLSRKCGDIVGAEMEIFGVNLWLAPAHNIHRSPLCGRNFEYLSEDPLLSGAIAASINLGVQAHEGCGTTIKHFCCNNQETNRYYSNSVLSERALREIYLKSFEVCVRRSSPGAVMTSYNLLNGEHACNRKDLLTYVLRDEWGFDGLVMTDWLVTGGMGQPGGKYSSASAAGNVKAGNDITMPGMTADFEDIKSALSDDGHAYPLSRAELQLAGMRVLKQALELVSR